MNRCGGFEIKQYSNTDFCTCLSNRIGVMPPRNEFLFEGSDRQRIRACRVISCRSLDSGCGTQYGINICPRVLPVRGSAFITAAG